eukprot:7385588-Prymnesium_polylepis.4
MVESTIVSTHLYCVQLNLHVVSLDLTLDTSTLTKRLQELKLSSQGRAGRPRQHGERFERQFVHKCGLAGAQVEPAARTADLR